NAQMRGRWRFDFGLYPHADDWLSGRVTTAAELYRHPLLVAHGAGGIEAPWPPELAGSDGMRLDGDAVVLSSLRRRDDGWIEARVVNLAADRRIATLTGEISEAREADLRGGVGAAMTLDANGAIRLDLGPCEIQTLQLRRREPSLARADLLDAAGPRQNG
ncbi:MAG: hypothetical protein M3Q38_03850, partial [Chloroflexota bacterium]|nr:hypothetical protein [Chloroflexota bacterium]